MPVHLHAANLLDWRQADCGIQHDDRPAGQPDLLRHADFDESDDADEAVKAAEEAFADDDDDTDADTDTDDFDEEYLKAFSKSNDSDAK